MTGRAHGQRQVAFFSFSVGLTRGKYRDNASLKTRDKVDFRKPPFFAGRS